MKNEAFYCCRMVLLSYSSLTRPCHIYGLGFVLLGGKISFRKQFLQRTNVEVVVRTKFVREFFAITVAAEKGWVWRTRIQKYLGEWFSVSSNFTTVMLPYLSLTRYC